MEFGWDEGKRSRVFHDRQIDLADMRRLFDGRPRLTFPSPRNDEARQVSVGEINGKFFAVVWLWRGDMIWIITARRARRREETQYRHLVQGNGNHAG
ncbi:MAG: BrnT family toxin [Alphaproteobacteria bacterium]|nr:BrnT family toxin [Alphaproteobacteria bacterium]